MVKFWSRWRAQKQKKRQNRFLCGSRDRSPSRDQVGSTTSFKEVQHTGPLFAGVCHSDCDSVKLIHINLPKIQLSMKISWRANLQRCSLITGWTPAAWCLLHIKSPGPGDERINQQLRFLFTATWGWSSHSTSLSGFCQLGIIGSEVFRWLVFPLWLLSGILFTFWFSFFFFPQISCSHATPPAFGSSYKNVVRINNLWPQFSSLFCAHKFLF